MNRKPRIYWAPLVAIAIIVTAGALSATAIQTLIGFQAKDPTFQFPAAPCQLLGPAQYVPDAYGSPLLVFTCIDGSVIGQPLSAIVNIYEIDHPAPPKSAPVPCDSTNLNWEGTGGTECAWRARYPVK